MRRALLTDCETTDFGSRSAQFNVCRDVRLDRVITRRGADIGNPGSGYGPTFMRCRDFLVVDSFSEATRHGFMATNGSTDGTYLRCQAPDSNFDTHGFDERRIRYVDCDAPTVNVGNPAYLGGAKNTTILDSRIGTLLVSSNTDRTTVLNSTLTNVAYQGVANDPKAHPTGGRATNVLVKWCVVNFVKTFAGDGDYDLTVEDTTLTGSDGPFVQVMSPRFAPGAFTFRRCLITILSKGTYAPFDLGQLPASFLLTLEDVAVKVKGAVWGAVYARKGFLGTVKLAGKNVFDTLQKQALFLANDPGGNVVAKGDAATVVKP